MIRRIRESERWKHRRASKPKAPVAPTSTPIVVPTPAPAPLTAADRARIAKWVASRIVTWALDRCLHCKRPIVYGAKWVEIVGDDTRARFHVECLPVWRAQQEIAARRALGLDP
jgi:hypothetical protein